MHADIGEEFLAGILQASTKNVDYIIDDEEAVVITLTYIYYNRCILLVMTLHIELLPLRELAMCSKMEHVLSSDSSSHL